MSAETVQSWQGHEPALHKRTQRMHHNHEWRMHMGCNDVTHVIGNYGGSFMLNASCGSCIDFRVGRERRLSRAAVADGVAALTERRRVPAPAQRRHRLFCCIFVVNHSPWPCATSSGPLHTTAHPSRRAPVLSRHITRAGPSGRVLQCNAMRCLATSQTTQPFLYLNWLRLLS